jgi:lipopolysaccharide export system permease protein
MKLQWHILRAHAGPFAFSLATLMFIFLLQFVMKFIDQLVGKGLGGWVISELIALNLAWMVVLAVPMSVLVATLMAFGGLSAGNEITAMKATGTSLYRMITGVALSAAVLAYLLVLFNNQVLPEANHRAKTLITDIRRIKPTLSISPGLFSQDVAGYSILARQTFERSNDLEGVTIYDYTDPSSSVVVTAKRGTVSFTPDYRKLVMDLYDGEIHRLDVREMGEYRRMRYMRHRIVMNAEGFDFERSDDQGFSSSRGDRELSARAMRAIVDSLERLNADALTHASAVGDMPDASGSSTRAPYAAPSEADLRNTALVVALNRERNALQTIENQILITEMNQQQINSFLVEIHKKYAIPVACIVFVFIGAPLGIMARRGTFGVGASLSLGFFLLYWASLIGGEKLADRGMIDPWLGMWMANIVLGLLGIILTVRTARETPALSFAGAGHLLPKALRARGDASAERAPRA